MTTRDIWVLLTCLMEWHEPILCTTTASREVEPLRPHNFEEINTSEVLWKQVLNKHSGSEVSQRLQTAPVRITIHYVLYGPHITKTVFCELMIYCSILQGHPINVYSHCNLLNEFSSIGGHVTNLNCYKLDPSVVVLHFPAIFSSLNRCITPVCHE